MPPSRRCWGTKWWPTWLEAPPGSEWRAGDRVVVEPVLPCEVRGVPPCRYCAQGQYNLCENFLAGELAPGVILGFTRGVGGGMAELMAAHPSRLVRVPENVPDEVAVLTDSLASALQPTLDNFPADRHTVVVYGAGIIGQQVIRLLRALGSAARVVVVARYRFQEELALEGGADVIMSNPSRTLLGEAVGARLVPTTLGGGNLEGGADFFFDCVGSKTSLQEGLLTLRGPGDPRSGGHRRRPGAGGLLQPVVQGAQTHRLLHLRPRRLPGPDGPHL